MSNTSERDEELAIALQGVLMDCDLSDGGFNEVCYRTIAQVYYALRGIDYRPKVGERVFFDEKAKEEFWNTIGETVEYLANEQEHNSTKH